MVCTGTKSEQEARTASRKYAKILQKLGYAVSFKVGGQMQEEQCIGMPASWHRCPATCWYTATAATATAAAVAAAVAAAGAA